MMTSKPMCAVIIVTHNSEDYLHKALSHLQEQTILPNTIIIVDSGSKNTNYLSPYKDCKNLQLIFSNENIGFCKGNNEGMKYVPLLCDYVFFLNPDAFLHPRYIQDALTFMEDPQNLHCGALTGVVLGYDMKSDQPSGRYDSTGIFQKWYGRWYDRDQGSECTTVKYNEPEKIPAICGAAFFCRKQALDSVMIGNDEVMDNTFYMYKEDIDLSQRLRLAQWSLYLLPHLIVYHCRGWNAERSKVSQKARLLSAKNEIRLHSKSPYILYSLIKYFSVRVFNI